MKNKINQLKQKKAILKETTTICVNTIIFLLFWLNLMRSYLKYIKIHTYLFS